MAALLRLLLGGEVRRSEDLAGVLVGGERTSTRLALPIAAITSSRNARIEVSGAEALYSVAGGRVTVSFDSSRPSSSHFLRPPSMSLTSWWPYSLKYQ